MSQLFTDVEDVRKRLESVDYLVDRGLATALFLAATLPQPILLEGEAGVGKTEAAKSLAQVLDTPLFRLQCYEGIDVADALYEWNYPRQLLEIRLAEARGSDIYEDALFGEENLIERPLLQALRHPRPQPAVLLIDEVDRADDEFEAFLFELLAETTVTIPELGTLSADFPPVVVLTSNRTRDLHDALKRRCLYHWIDYPDVEHAARIVRRRVPAASVSLTKQAVSSISGLRKLDLQKQPGVAEAIDWVAALHALGVQNLDKTAAGKALGSVLKYREDIDLARAHVSEWLASTGPASG
jgi:MoxR-like ATPase